MTEHQAAVNLRTAAADFAANHPVLDAHDRAGQCRNRRLLDAAVRYAMTKKRGYSRDFTPKTDRRLAFMADKVPAKLHEAVMAKVKREETSVRTVILTLLERWVKPD